MDQLLPSDALECSVCLEQFDATARALPCQHTFCRRCLDDIVQTHKELRCPECRVLVQVPLSELPPNILLMRILESMKTAPPRTNTTTTTTTIHNQLPWPPSLQPLGRLNPHVMDGPPLTQAPPPPLLSSSSSSYPRPYTYFTTSDRGGGVGVGRGVPYGSDSLGSSYGGGGGGGSLGRGGGGQDVSVSGGVSISSSSVSGSGSGSSGFSMTSSPSSQSQQQQQHITPTPTISHHRQTSLQPCAKALYNYERKETGDLSFKKGDVILLRKKIDSNWYQGELNNQTGFFPASYVQVITPLPSHIPQCKALYDFKMTNDEERDCLTFNKGEIITVLRRVDENWAEGKLGARIGIFPLSFVDLNAAAKTLMKFSLNAQQGPSRLAPPTPTSMEGETPTPLILGEVGGGGANPPPSSCTSLLDSSSSSSSVVTSPDPSLTSPTSTSPPGPAPPTPPMAAPPLLRGANNTRHQREKRHSFTAPPRTLNPSPPHSPASPHRHSIEIISPSEDNSSGPTAPSGPVVDVRLSAFLSPTLLSLTTAINQVIESRASTFYVALYSYRGRKGDELELRKGYIYTVSEKCQDGWFKGRCLTTERTGVFPGNYVQLAKPQMLEAYLAKRGVRLCGQSRSNSDNSSSTSPGVVSYTRPRPGQSGDGSRGPVSGGGSSNSTSAASLPPELPPRSVSSSVEGPPSLRPSAAHTTSLSWHATSPTPHSYSSTQRSVSGVSNAVSPPPNVALGEPNSTVTGASTPTKATDRKNSKDRGSSSGGSSGGGGMSLMRKFTGSSSKKKSKSPPPSYSMDNPVFEDPTIITTTSTTTATTHHAHTRSGSCPGTLVGGVGAGGSCRLRARERPGVVLASLVMRARSGSNPDTGGHPPSSSSSSSPSSTLTPTPSTTDSNTDTPRRKKTPAPLVKERFRCIVPYPPNSEYELELQLGDIIYVHKKREDGWYKGTLQRTGKTGLFPASFVDSC
ncbi:hypothetical protein Pmani_016334 [Petrolisthes manimaculis]|uniref:RING-type E3 ubiquitin transferase n=1 Tax=Petrolisthes manimaculis TaxID=1843537 RepID=A0AAE1PP45_9EUCA|nr:hypothetical protein Pmani_016334 [Petrolisthes manimaculis]